MSIKDSISGLFNRMWNAAGQMVDTQAKADVATKAFQVGAFMEKNYEELAKAKENEEFEAIFTNAGVDFPMEESDIDCFKDALAEGEGGEDKAM